MPRGAGPWRRTSGRGPGQQGGAGQCPCQAGRHRDALGSHGHTGLCSGRGRQSRCPCGSVVGGRMVRQLCFWNPGPSAHPGAGAGAGAVSHPAWGEVRGRRWPPGLGRWRRLRRGPGCGFCEVHGPLQAPGRAQVRVRACSPCTGGEPSLPCGGRSGEATWCPRAPPQEEPRQQVGSSRPEPRVAWARPSLRPSTDQGCAFSGTTCRARARDVQPWAGVWPFVHCVPRTPAFPLECTARVCLRASPGWYPGCMVLVPNDLREVAPVPGREQGGAAGGGLPPPGPGSGVSPAGCCSGKPRVWDVQERRLDFSHRVWPLGTPGVPAPVGLRGDLAPVGLRGDLGALGLGQRGAASGALRAVSLIPGFLTRSTCQQTFPGGLGFSRPRGKGVQCPRVPREPLFHFSGWHWHGPSLCGVPSPLSCGVPCGGAPQACGNTPLPLARSHPPGGRGSLVRSGESGWRHS